MLLSLLGKRVHPARRSRFRRGPVGGHVTVFFQASQGAIESGPFDLGVGKGVPVEPPGKIIARGVAFFLEHQQQNWLDEAIQVTHRTGAWVLVPWASGLAHAWPPPGSERCYLLCHTKCHLHLSVDRVAVSASWLASRANPRSDLLRVRRSESTLRTIAIASGVVESSLSRAAVSWSFRVFAGGKRSATIRSAKLSRVSAASW